MYLNGKKFELFKNDNKNTILIRIAKQLNTIPKYLFFNCGIPDSFTDSNVKVTDILKVIKDNPDFTELYTQISEQKQYFESIDIDDILIPFLIYHPQNEFILVLTFYLESELGIPNAQDKIDKILRDLPKLKSELEDEIKQNTSLSKEETKLFKTLDDTPGIPTTPFEPEKISYSFYITIPNINSNLEIFNSLILNPTIPFAVCGKFYKILKDFIPKDNWEQSIDDIIILKMQDINNPKEYTDVVMEYTEQSSGENVLITMIINISTKRKVEHCLIIDQILQIIPNADRPTTVSQNKISGTFYIPNQSLNTYLFADLLLNDPLFASMMAIDESTKATKIRDSVYVHFKNQDIGEVAFNITEKIAEKGDPSLIGKDVLGEFKFGSTFLRIKIVRAENDQAVINFQNLFGKLIAIYNKHKPKLLKIYKEYIPGFGTVTEKPYKKPTKIILKNIAPEVFVKGYPTLCLKQPSIISDSEIPIEEAKGKRVMTFPATENEGIIQRNYICNHKDHPFPGLRENNRLSNKDLVPYLPCCYAKDHSQTKNNLYQLYYHGQPLQKQDQAFSRLLLTNKFAKKDIYGTLPENINNLLNIFAKNTNQIFVRKGMDSDTSSLLECISTALSGTLDFNMENIETIRQNMATDENAALCKQSMYDYTIQEIKDIIQDPLQNMPSQLFVSMLQEIFNCYIFVFAKTLHEGYATIVKPRSLETYLEWIQDSDRPVILLYEHYGTKADFSEQPKCELIVEWNLNKKIETQSVFNLQSPLIQTIQKLYTQSIQGSKLGNPIPRLTFPILDKLNIISQGLDTYGKCRMLLIDYQGDIGTLLTSPMPPLSFPIQEDLQIKTFTNKTGEKMRKEWNLTRDQNSGKLHRTIGNVELQVPLQDFKSKTGYVDTQNSSFHNFNKYKKLARYITSYTLWLYSHFLFNNGLEPSDDSLLQFVDNHIIIDPTFIYTEVPKAFSLTSGVMKDNKLVIKSQEALKRLLFKIRLLSKNSKKTKMYRSQTQISDYYFDITDFTSHTNQIIIEGQISVLNLIDEQDTKLLLVDHIIQNRKSPYVFSNILVQEGEPFIAQQAPTLPCAIQILQNWSEKGNNVGYQLDQQDIDCEVDNLDCIFHIYVSPKEITSYKVGKGTDKQIIGYRTEEGNNFIALIPLN